MLAEEDILTLCAVLETTQVKSHIGKEGLLGLLVKNPNKAPTISNLRGITIASHLSKVEPLAYFGAKDVPEIIIKAAGGPFLMGGLKGVAISDMVRLALMGHEVAQMKQHMGPKDKRPAGWSILVMDKEKFHDLLTQDGLPAVGARVGLGTTQELTSYTQGFTTQVQMGAHVTPKMSSQGGTPQGAGQSIRTGNMNTLPAVVKANRHYERYKSHILGSIQLVWVDDVLALAVSPSRDSASRGQSATTPCRVFWWTLSPTTGPSMASPILSPRCSGGAHIPRSP